MSVLIAPSLLAEPSFQTVALSGQPILDPSGLGANPATFDAINGFSIFEGGVWLVDAQITTGSGTADVQTLLRALPSGFSTELQAGQTVSGLATGQTLDSFDLVDANRFGDLAVRGVVGFDTVGLTRINGVTELLAREGDAAPGLTARFFDDNWSAILINDRRDLAFRAEFSTSPFGGGTRPGSENEVVYFAGDGQSLSPLLRDKVAGPPGLGGALSKISGPQSLTENGDVLVWVESQVQVAPALGEVRQAILLITPQGVSTVWAEGGPSPVSGSTFAGIGTPRFNRQGETAFVGDLLDGQTTIQAFFAPGPGGLIPIGIQGDDAPGLPGIEYEAFSPAFALNARGQAAFRAELSGPSALVDLTSNEALFGPVGDEIRLIAREGDPAPGAGGDRFARLVNSLPLLTGAGSTIFSASLQASDGSDLPSDVDQALFFHSGDPDDELMLLLREGQLFDVDDDPGEEDFRQIISWNVVPVDAVSGPEANQLALRLVFADGSTGAFAVSIPEPTTLASAAWLMLMMTARRRRTAPCTPCVVDRPHRKDTPRCARTSGHTQNQGHHCEITRPVR
ncbi:MAG: choice-of-anchor tandem repeat NxxGxxAF-containing protein [Planctomycetota bacterium]